MSTPTDDAYITAVNQRLGKNSPFSRRTVSDPDAPQDDQLTEMRHNRRVNAKLQQRTAALGGGGGTGGGGAADIAFATGRPRDPMWYWKQNNLPWDVNNPDHLKKIRAFCRVLYITHPIVGSCVDIYSKYPLLGMELECKDDQIKEFYESLFLDEENGLNWSEFALDVGREYWVVGEAWPFASFNEMLGVWDDEELLNPDDIEVFRSPFLKEPRFLIKLPQSLRDVLTTMSPRWEYDKLMQLYPELRAYASEDAMMPVSNMLLRQLKFKADTFNKRGVPLLMRAIRPLMQEEMLNAAMDAIADRLYTPLILVKLGASAQDLGTQVPWIPTQDDLADFEEAFDAAMAADFRVLTHHFAVTMEPVFGREQMPDMSNDFDRLEDRILQTFGLSRTMLEGASGGETYAADALNRDLISQLLTTYQDLIKRLFRQRALIVAEAQGHYDYDERNGKRYVKMEEILEVDEETGEERIVEQPALLIPELRMRTMNMRDENVWRQFIEAVVATGAPISMKTRLRGAEVDLDEEREVRKQEAVADIVAEQEVRREAFLALRAQGLPIPPELAADFQPIASDGSGNQQQGAGAERIPTLGLDPAGTPNLQPTQSDMATQTDDPAADGQASNGLAAVVPIMPAQPQRPPESDEQRSGMPTAAQLHRNASRMRTAVADHYVAPDNSQEQSKADWQPTGKFGNPKHTGLRRHARNWSVLKDVPMDEWDQSA